MQATAPSLTAIIYLDCGLNKSLANKEERKITPHLPVLAVTQYNDHIMTPASHDNVVKKKNQKIIYAIMSETNILSLVTRKVKPRTHR